jgi:hypothetical protein
MKDMYMKVRAEHLEVLKTLGERQKEKSGLEATTEQIKEEQRQMIQVYI